MKGLGDVKLSLIDSLDDVLTLKEWMGERRPLNALAFDTETTGLVVGTDRVRLAQIGDGNRGFAMDWSKWRGLFEAVVNQWEGDLLAHNAKFDVGMLDHEGFKMPRHRIKDTRIMHHVLYPQYSSALKNIATRLVDASAANLQDALKGTAYSWANVPIGFVPYWSYGALDPVLTYRVAEKLWPEVEAEAPVAFQIENDVTWIIERMERYGAHIDVEYAKEKYEAFTQYVREAEAWCLSTYGVKPGSNAAIIKILQDEGYEFTKATASGAVALDKEVLGHIDHPLAQTVLQRRQLQKLATTYLRHFIEEVDDDHCIHPSINVLGARTGRMSMERPNLQNLPRKNANNPAADTIRNCVKAREHHALLMCDFDQVEMRMLASMAREESMIEAFKGKTDFFVALARMIYGDETIEKKDPRRQVTKNAGYATIYGAGVAKFSATAGISEEQGRAVRERWDTLFPRVLLFQREVQNVALARRHSEGIPYVRCPVTNRRQVADPGKEYALVNFLIQGAAAAVLKKKLIELDNAGLGPYMVVPVHDEIIVDCPSDIMHDVADTLKKVMNDTEMFAVPLSASVSWGDRWGSKETYDHRS